MKLSDIEIKFVELSHDKHLFKAIVKGKNPEGEEITFRISPPIKIGDTLHLVGLTVDVSDLA